MPGGRTDTRSGYTSYGTGLPEYRNRVCDTVYGAASAVLPQFSAPRRWKAAVPGLEFFMKAHLIGFAGVMAAALALPCCSDNAGDATIEVANPPPSNAEDTWEAVKQYTVERSAEFRADLSARLSDLERQMEPLAARTGLEWETINADLAQKRDALAAKLETLAAATAETWEQARDETIALYLDLRDAIARAAGEPGQ